ncbi:MAG: peroxidase [Actinomycetota bacterium]
MHHGEALTRESGDASLKETVVSGRFEDLSGRMEALARFAVKLTVVPAQMTEEDVVTLREAGLDDRAIVDLNQVVAYFNYVNRIADGLGVELEDRWPADTRQPRHYELRETFLRSLSRDEGGK